MNTEILAAHVLNGYVWALLKTNTSMTENDYGTKVPVIPSNQEPEFRALNKPFLVYGFTEDHSHDIHLMRSGTLFYTIYASNLTDINRIFNIIETAMGRYDESATDVNAWSSKAPQNTNFLGCRFTEVCISYGEGGGPVDQEGGRLAAVIGIKYSFVPTYSVITAL